MRNLLTLLLAITVGTIATVATAGGPSRFVKVEFVDAEAVPGGYRVNGEVVSTAEFERTHFKISDDASGEINEATVDRFVTGMMTVQAGSRSTVSTASTRIGLDVVKSANCAQTYAFDFEQSSKASEARARANVWEFLGFVHQWAEKGLSCKLPKRAPSPDCQCPKDTAGNCPCTAGGGECKCVKPQPELPPQAVRPALRLLASARLRGCN